MEAETLAERQSTTVMSFVNEEIAELAAQLGHDDDPSRLWSFACECGNPSCREHVELALADYLAVRADGDAHVLAPDHVIVRARRARGASAAAQAMAEATHGRAKELLEEARALVAEAKQARRHRATTRRSKPVLYLVSSRTSGPGRRLEGWVAQMLQHKRNHDSFDLQLLDPADDPDLVNRLGIDALPAIAVVEGHQVRAQLSRPRGTTQIRETLSPWLR